MLQEATRAINSAFNNSFVKKLSLYLHDCIREEVKSSTFRNLKSDKENKWIFLTDEDVLFTQGAEYLKLDGKDNKITELMIQSEMSQRDKYLIYGYLFIVGKTGKSRKQNEFLTPLLYMSCRLERNGININCIPTDEIISLNTGALTSLMKKSDDEDEMEQLIEGLLDVVPTIPVTQEKLDVFLTTLKSIIPEIDISLNPAMTVEEDNISKDFYSEKITAENVEDIVEEEQSVTAAKTKYDTISITNQCAIILTKRPSITAGVLHELSQIAEKPSGLYRETVLNVINEEFIQSKPTGNLDGKKLSDFFPVTPLSLSDAQESVIRNTDAGKIVSVFGPPGTGKSQTIVNLVAHLIANGKTVLVASRMDKAVDVVADRLNELGAPFLALRAGRQNYQKQLSFQLQDLLANKVDLNIKAENSVLVDIPDMKKLLESIKELENKVEKVLSMEKRWTELSLQVGDTKSMFGAMSFIKKTLKRDEINTVESVADTLTQTMEKSGILTSFKNFASLRKLNSILGKEFSVSNDNLSILRNELEYTKLVCEQREIETSIQATGNMHLMMGQIKTLKKKQRELAINILVNKRREALKGLMQDQVKRQRLFVHSKSLVERKKNLQDRLLSNEDFKPLLEAFPCWCVTTFAVSSSLPLKPGLFDVVIIDEASQCDIASCFPLLFRAKKAVVVGDDKQLPHLSFLEKAKEQSFLSQYGIEDKYQLMWRFRTNSMFDLANYYSMHPVLLDEHFRSLPPIINFSANEFYGGRLRVMKRNNDTEPVLEAVVIQEGKVDFDATRNLPEIEAVVKRLHEIVLDDERKNPDNPVSIGIISPFRAQVEQLKVSVSKVLSDYMITKHKIEIGTAHTFQGDEKDIILVSWAFANNSFPQSLTFLQKPNLFNVAITRARKKMINFISKNPKELPDGLLRSYFSYIEDYTNRYKLKTSDEFDENIYKNNFEREVAEALRAVGHTVKAGQEISGVNADLLVDDSFVIECDGVEDSKSSNVSDTKKQVLIERSGIPVKRITYREWQYSSQACINRVLNT